MDEAYDAAGKSPPTHCEFDHQIFGHPDDVLEDTRLSIAQKRALLASWATDANAVPHLPTLRQLPDGSMIKVDEILRALKSLDLAEGYRAVDHDPGMAWQRPFSRLRRSVNPVQVRRRRRPDDDDDPPPFPACAARPPRASGGGCVAVAEPEVVPS
jgi:hypothetical protein